MTFISQGHLDLKLVAKGDKEMTELFGKSTHNVRIEIDNDEDYLVPTENILCDDDDLHNEYLSRENIKSFDPRKMGLANRKKGKAGKNRLTPR